MGTDDAVQEKMLSKLRFFSVGVVAANKKLDSHSIEVAPIEHFNFMDGEITDNKTEYKASGSDATGEEWETIINTTPSLMARWLPLGNTNRKTSPDVRRGEIVMVYQYGDADEYWWVDMMQDKKLRRLETVVWALSNNSKENIEDDSDSTYWIEWSTHRKVLHIHTSKNDGEPFAYDFQLDTKKGIFQFRDDDDNYIFLNSKEKIIHLHNKDNSFIDINKKDIKIRSTDNVFVETSNFIVKASKTIQETTQKMTVKSQSFTHNNGGAYAITTSQYSNRASQWSVNSSSWKVTVPTAEFSGNTRAGGISYAADHD